MATYTGPSIVDYLKSIGKDSSYAARSKMAADYGINNYTGTAAQNTQLLNTLRNPASTVATTPAVGTAQPVTSTPKLSWGETYQKTADAYAQNKNAGTVAVPTGNNSGAQNVRTDLANLNNLNLNPAADTLTYKDPFEDKINAAIDKILSTDLSKPYDVTSDPLYAPLKQQYDNAGTAAFNNQIGRLSALTGGRPSTAAVGAATQSQNAYANQFASSALPELINADQTRRLNEYNNILSQLEALRGLSNTVYNRDRDAIADARYADETTYARGQDAIQNTGTMTVDDILATIPANSQLRNIPDYSAAIAKETDPWVKAQLQALRVAKINVDPALQQKYGSAMVIPTFQTQDARQQEIENRMAQAEYELDQKYKNAQIENIRIDNARQAASAVKAKEPDIMTAPLDSLGTDEQIQNYNELRNIYFGGGRGTYKDNPYGAYQRMLQFRNDNVDVMGEKLYNRLLTEIEDYLKIDKSYGNKINTATTSTIDDYVSHINKAYTTSSGGVTYVDTDGIITYIDALIENGVDDEIIDSLAALYGISKE